MQNHSVEGIRSRRRLIVGSRIAAALTLASCCAWAVAAGEAAALNLHFVGLKSSQGAVMVALYDNEAAYENSSAASDTAVRSMRLDIKDGAAGTTFTGLPPGQYAIKAFHDMNGDFKLNTNLFGAPTEPVAFSNDAPVHMRAPSWKETVFEVRAGDNSISIHIE